MKWQWLSVVTMALSLGADRCGLTRTTDFLDKITGVLVWLERRAR
jgi:hypothetical protein